jgi:branched-chain amino acid transport system substrate-binding protein
MGLLLALPGCSPGAPAEPSPPSPPGDDATATPASVATTPASVATVSPSPDGEATTCPGAAGQTVTIGVIAPITGQAAADGQEYVRGVELAIEHVNAAGGAGGYTLQHTVGDSGPLTAAAVVSQVQRIAGDPNVHVFMTGYADLDNAEIDTLNEMGYPYLVSGNTNSTREIVSKDPSNYPMTWGLGPWYVVYAEYPGWLQELADAGKWTPRDRSYFMITSDNANSTAVASFMRDGFEEIGWNEVGNETTPTQAISDWGAVLTKIQSANPDVVINTDFTTGNAQTFLSQFRRNPTESIVYIDYAPALPEFIPIVGDDAEGLTSSLAGAPIDTLPRTQQIKADFKEKYGVETGKYGVVLYESVMVYADALALVCDPSDRLAIGNAIGETNKLTAMGQLQFDPETHLAQTGAPGTFPYPIYQIQDGQLLLLSPDEYANGEFQLPSWME